MASSTMADTLRLVTWNVNGLRAMLQRLKRSKLKELLVELGADVVCFQETKTARSELDEDLVRPDGYDAFYSFCRIRGGYSGVVTYCRNAVVPTVAAEEGLTGMWKVEDPVGHYGTTHLELSPKVLTELESEGRCVITDHEAFVLINVYCPALASADRLEYKLAFHNLLQDRVRTLQQAGRHVIVVGDINISHREIDHCDPGPNGDVAFSDHPCRQWMDRFAMSTLGEATSSQDTRLVDAFRHLNPTMTKAFTCWNMVTAARQTNYGTRIDYVLVDRQLLSKSLVACSIDPDQTGSDHCPVVCQLEIQVTRPVGVETKTASLCAKYYAEFAGRQQSLKTFFSQHTEVSEALTDGTENEKPLSQSSESTGDPKKTKSGMKSPAQKSIKAFFVQPKQLETTQHAKKTSLMTSSVAPSLSDAVDISVWNSFVGAKRRLVEEEQSKWKQVLSGQPPQTPLCHCGEPTVLRTVLKTNENWGRKFYVCTRPAGEKGHPDARCEFFQWVDQRGNNKKAKR